MKVKYQQLYQNECGLCSIRNLLFYYKIKSDDVILKYSEEGTTIFDIVKTLKSFFYDVKAISFDINQLKKVKIFSPFIALLKKNDCGHYVVVYKKNRKYLYICDSLRKRTYKLSYKKFLQVFSKNAILVMEKKEIEVKTKNSLLYFFIFLLTVFESLFLLSTTLLLQQVIDNGFNNVYIYIVVQLAILLIVIYKSRLFLKTFKKMDENICLKTIKAIHNLNKNYINKHSLDEVFYRLNDAYEYKNMNLSLIYNLSSDLVLAILTICLMLFYSYIITFIILFFCIFIIIISTYIFKKTRIIVEEKRKEEYLFLNNYQESIKKYGQNEKNTIESLKKVQYLDYKLQKITLIKNLLLMSFQTMIIIFLVILYFTNLYDKISVGSLVALINLTSIMLQPILNLSSEISNYSNYYLIKQRLEDINKNIK